MALLSGLADDMRVDVCLFVPRLKLDAAQALSPARIFDDGAMGAFPNLFDAFYFLKRARLLHTVVNELIVKAEPFTLVRSKPMPLSIVKDSEDATPATWLSESIYAEVVHLLSKTLSPKRLSCQLRFHISATHAIDLLRHPWVNGQREHDLSVSYVFSPRRDVHVDAESRTMAVELANYLAEDLEGSALQTLCIRVANVAIFACEYAKRFVSATDPTPIPALTFEEHHHFNPMRPAKTREAVILDGAIFGQPLVQVPELRKVNVIQNQCGIDSCAAEERQQTEVYLIRNANLGLEATVSCAAYRSSIMPGVPSTVLLCQFRMGNHVPRAHEVDDYFVADPWQAVEHSSGCHDAQ
ncbi:hypothetical protein AAVH_18135 [Aphelenchoides avenae]|nr:hypothetical protein AAVH_18135 [Aphelenchus avenae]